MDFKLLICISFLCYLNHFHVNSSILKTNSNDCDPQKDCNGHGQCNAGSCLCSPGYWGTNCQFELKENVSNVCITQDCIERAALITTSIDDTVYPCDDFYKYACGNWLKEHFVPKNATYRYGHFTKLTNKIEDRLYSKLIKGYQSDEPVVLKRVYNFYNSCVDMESRNKTGLKDLKEMIDSVGGWPVIEPNWNEENYHWEDGYVKMTQIYGIQLPFYIYVTTNLKNRSEYILQFGSPYTRFSHMTEMDSIEINGIIKQEDPFKLFPKFDIFADPTKEQEDIASDLKGSPVSHEQFVNDTKRSQELSLRLQKAASHIKINGTLTDWEMKNYDDLLWSVDQLKNATPNINWDKIFMGLLGRTNYTRKILVIDANFTHNLNNILAQFDKRAMAHYYALNTAQSLIRYTTEKYHKKYFSYMSLQRACYQSSSSAFYDLQSKLYLNEFGYDLKHKKNIEEIVQMIRSSFHQLLDENTWMDPATKKIAKEKLLAIQPNVGAPDILFDDKQLENLYIEYGNMNQSYLKNMVKTLEITNRRRFKLLESNSTSTGTFWSPASTVNAFYNPASNQISIPAGISQIPFYAFTGPISANLGTIGMIIGHELTHGFDNSGSQFDLHGVHKNWWTNETLEKFKEKNQCFVKQYDRFDVPEANRTVNGTITLGENIADNGGIREAFYALQNYKKQVKGGQSIDKLPGDLAQLSDEKVFFLSYAAQWCENNDPVTARRMLADVHSPAYARVILPLANFDQFAKAFNCPVNSRMNPKDKCIVW